MSETVVGRAGEQIAETARTASRLTSAMADAVEEGLGGARRVAKHAGDAAEEFFDDTTKRLGRHPVETVVGSARGGHRHRNCDRVVNLPQVGPAIDREFVSMFVALLYADCTIRSGRMSWSPRSDDDA
jgi:hypothetical protein